MPIDESRARSRDGDVGTLPVPPVANAAAPTARPDPAKIEFGKTFCPRMLRMEYDGGRWNAPRLEPLAELRVHPGATVFQYAQAVFEGMKAFLTAGHQIVLFRPELNAERLRASAERLHMPAVDVPVFLQAIEMLVKDQAAYVPHRPGSLYLRPTMIGTEPALGVRSSTEFQFYIVALPSGPYFRNTGHAGAIEILVSRSVGRACAGGMGNVKAAANYAGTLDVIARAKAMGCDQVLFLDTVHRANIEELGGMNVFFVRGNRLVTPPLTDTLLAGITRDCVIRVAQDMGIEVSEEPLPVDRVMDEIRTGAISEAMACGTAAVVAGIRRFRFEDGAAVAVGQSCPGPVSRRIYERLVAIQYGAHPDEHGWLWPVCDAGAP